MQGAKERALRFRAEMADAASRQGAARRREELVRRATADGVLEREQADEVYDLAAEESVEAGYALALVRSGYLVRELVPPEPPEETMQQDAPPWVGETPETDEVVRERRLRASLRRLRQMLERCDGPAAAADAYLAEPDVAPGEY